MNDVKPGWSGADALAGVPTGDLETDPDAVELRGCLRSLGGIVERLARLQRPTRNTRAALRDVERAALLILAWRTDGDA